MCVDMCVDVCVDMCVNMCHGTVGQLSPRRSHDYRHVSTRAVDMSSAMADIETSAMAM